MVRRTSRRGASATDTITQLVRLVTSDDDRFVKTGIQGVCDVLERKRLDEAARGVLRRALSYQLNSEDVYVRRWLYKALGLFGETAYVPYLRAQLRNHDFVAENRSWAVAALAAITGSIEQELSVVGEDFSLAYRLSSRMFGRTRVRQRDVVSASSIDDALVHQWIGLLYGSRRLDAPTGFLRELTGSREPAVAEYAIWGIRKRGDAGIDAVALDPVSIAAQPENVRRWYYRLLLQDHQNLERYEELLVQLIRNERGSKAREGLALGLSAVRPLPREWRDLMREWARSEADPYVRLALRYFDDADRQAILAWPDRIGPLSKAIDREGGAMSRSHAAQAASRLDVGGVAHDVFVVHGRNARAKAAMFTFLRSIDVKPMEWTQAVAATGSSAPFIGQVIETAFKTTRAVIVLLTGDDLGCLRPELRNHDDPAYEREPTPQARPNVLFEAGYAFALHPERTILVEFGLLRPFSDVQGRHVIRMDDSTEKRQELAHRLTHAGCKVDLSGTDWHRAGDFSNVYEWG